MQFVLKSFKSDLTVTKLANVHYFEFTPNYHTVNDSHGFCELVYVDKGSVEISSDSYTGSLQQSEMLLHGANQNHSLTCNERVAPNLIIIGFECAADSLETLTRAPLRLTEELQKILAEIIKEARTVYLPPYNVPNVKNMKKRKSFAFGADLLIRDYLQIFLVKCLRLTAQPTQHTQKHVALEKTRIYEIKRYLDENYRQKITVEELCFLFNTNKTTLSAAFKRAFGITMIDYVNALRIEYTKSLLREGNHTLTQIADLLALSSVHYLTALFKKHTAMTPTEYLYTIENTLNLEN